jgi:hypothetical protein
MPFVRERHGTTTCHLTREEMMIIAHFGFGAMRGSYANGQRRERSYE